MTHGNFYFRDNGQNKFIFQFIGNDVTTPNINVCTKRYNCGDGMGSALGRSTIAGETLREATREEIFWFLECQRQGKYVEQPASFLDNYVIF